MTTGLNYSNYQSILNRAQSDVSQLLNITNGMSFGEGVDKYVESISVFIDAGNYFANGNAEQKEAAAQTIASRLMDLLGSLGTKESAKAEKKVEKNEKEIDKNDEKADDIRTTLDEQLNNIMEECAKGAVSIQDALKIIQELGGEDNGAIAEKEEELEEQLAIIEQNKAILNNGVSNKEAKKQALLAILGAASEINRLVSEVTEYASVIQEQQKIVEENSEKIADLQKGATATLHEGVKELLGITADNQILAVQNTELATESVQQNTVGTQQVAIGSAMESSVISSASGTKYILSGNDKIFAGATLMQGAIKNIGSLNVVNGKIVGHEQACLGFIQGLNKFGEGAGALVGEFDTTANALITAVGSWESYKTANVELQQAVDEYMGEFNSGSQTIESRDKAASIPVWSSYNTQQNRTEQIEGYKEDIDKKDTDDYKKFEFDTSMFKKQQTTK